MNKNILIALFAVFGICTCAALIIYLKPNTDSATTANSSQTVNANNENDSKNHSTESVNIEHAEPDHSDSSKKQVNTDALEAETSSTPTIEGKDLNTLVYGEKENNVQGNNTVADGSKNSSDSLNANQKTQYANTKSDPTLKPIDPETDPSNQLVDASAVQPLKEELPEEASSESTDSQ